MFFGLRYIKCTERVRNRKNEIIEEVNRVVYRDLWEMSDYWVCRSRRRDVGEDSRSDGKKI